MCWHWINPAQLSGSASSCVGECVGAAESEPRIRYEIVRAGTPWTRRRAGEGLGAAARFSSLSSALHICSEQRRLPRQADARPLRPPLLGSSPASSRPWSTRPGKPNALGACYSRAPGLRSESPRNFPPFGPRESAKPFGVPAPNIFQLDKSGLEGPSAGGARGCEGPRDSRSVTARRLMRFDEGDDPVGLWKRPNGSPRTG